MDVKAQPTILTRGVDLALTPDQVFDNLHRVPGFFFLDSGLADHELSRFSYVGLNPFLTLRSRGEGMDLVEGKTIRHLRGNPLTVLTAQLAERRLTGGSPMIPFPGGGVGYFGFELGAITTDRPSSREDDLGLPEMQISFYRNILAYEHRTKRWFGAAVDLQGGRGATIRKRLGKEIDKLVDLVQKPAHGPASSAVATSGDEEGGASATPGADTASGRSFTMDGVQVSSTMSREEYLAGVRRIQEHISAGDIYQANLTQRWTVDFDGDAGRLYRALREVSPAPFGIYLNTGECILAGSSPESFLSVHGRAVETRPIKGTRPRGASPEEDERMKRELIESRKDQAELTMIADLERNDLGRVCEAGTVEVSELHRLETFSNVHHLVSVIKGELRAGTTPEQLLKATFPSGSVTGAPKLRAMEILEEIEGTVRGPYTGAMGSIGFDGSVELNVAIRTLVITQGKCHLGVGSGIVADSNPEAEYEECRTKARDMLVALQRTATTAEPSPTT